MQSHTALKTKTTNSFPRTERIPHSSFLQKKKRSQMLHLKKKMGFNVICCVFLLLIGTGISSVYMLLLRGGDELSGQSCGSAAFLLCSEHQPLPQGQSDQQCVSRKSMPRQRARALGAQHWLCCHFPYFHT